MNIEFRKHIFYKVIFFQFILSCTTPTSRKNCLYQTNRSSVLQYPKFFYYKIPNRNYCYKYQNYKYKNTGYLPSLNKKNFNYQKNYYNKYWKYITISVCGTLISTKFQNNDVFADIKVHDYHARCPNSECAHPIKIPENLFKISDYREFIVYANFQCEQYGCRQYFRVKSPYYTKAKSFLSWMPIVGSSIKWAGDMYENYQEEDLIYVVKDVAGRIVPIPSNAIENFSKISECLSLAQRQYYQIILDFIICKLKEAETEKNKVFTAEELLDKIIEEDYFYKDIKDKFKNLRVLKNGINQEFKNFIKEQLDDAFNIYGYNDAPKFINSTHMFYIVFENKLTLDELDKIINKINNSTFLESIPYDGVVSI